MKKLPNWLTLGPDGAAVRLSRPTEFNGVKIDRLSLRTPEIGDLRAAKKVAGSDNEQQEIILFASLAGCSPTDIGRLAVKDYNRVQEGYFRLVSDDEDGAAGSADTGAPAGD
ncbi:MAG: phage tail assembly protein [Burkholderiaceae bacterium]